MKMDDLAAAFDGELHTGEAMRRIYATDASVYQEMPTAVAIPATKADLVRLVRFAGAHRIGLIPRTAGTSLAGQVVGSGIVVDLSRHFTEILEINAEEGWVRCQPGVIRNELNLVLQPHGLLFGPETSTQNRAMVGGMLGNNSCGSNSIRYGSVRDHLLEARAILSDGSEVSFGPLTPEEFEAKCALRTLEGNLYRQAREMLGAAEVREEISAAFPKPSITRRNTGYALDALMDAAPLDPASTKPFHFGKLLAGSEGTLCLVTEVKLHCDPLPPPVSGLQCAHFDTIDEALRATRIAVKHNCYACELIDHFILDCTERSLEHRNNRFFLQGKPQAILVTELRGESEAAVRDQFAILEGELRQAGLGYAWPLLFGHDTTRVWNLRKAGLGLLSNMPGDEKPVAVIEDTAVDVEDLPEYIREFDRRLQERFGLECVHYAHAGSGEIHLRPLLNLKTEEGNRRFREVAETIAQLVREYRGSLSGEHGDGRLRGEFIERMIGPANYQRLRAVKETWDPQHLFNPGKIIDTPPMNRSLRYRPGQTTPDPKTVFDWSSTRGMLGAAEMCNGSGDCRKTQLSGGTMCPSYMATRNERDTTRARANLLRQMLTEGARQPGEALFDHPEVKEVLDLCLSCKGCKKECPSTVDLAKLKAEFTQQYQDLYGVPLRSRLIANFSNSQRLARLAPWLWNALFRTRLTRRLLNTLVGFHPDRTIPAAPRQTLRDWFSGRKPPVGSGRHGRVWLLADEFTNYTDVEAGKAAVELLERLGYGVDLAPVQETGRSRLSKGLVREARGMVRRNVRKLARRVDSKRPLVGVEPSALLTFRDEAIDLMPADQREMAERLARSSLLLEEFLAGEYRAGRISSESFTDEARTIHLHGHCFQKALAGVATAETALSIPKNFRVTTIPSGCCGMAGSFGYEKEHYPLSMQIAELVLLPAVRQAASDDLLAAAGTSCRHQIHDGTGRTALHPAEILRDALV